MVNCVRDRISLPINIKYLEMSSDTGVFSIGVGQYWFAHQRGESDPLPDGLRTEEAANMRYRAPKFHSEMILPIFIRNPLIIKSLSQHDR